MGEKGKEEMVGKEKRRRFGEKKEKRGKGGKWFERRCEIMFLMYSI